MKNILAENMLRFGVKNLKTEHIAKLNILAEQDPTGAGIESSKQTGDFDNSVEDDQVNVDVEKGSANLGDPSQAYITKDPVALARLQKNSAMNRLANIKKDSAANPKSDAIEADMAKRYGDDYYNLIRNFSNNQQGGESQNLWFRRFPQSIRDEFLKQFPSMIGGLTSYTVHIHRGTGRTETEKIEPTGGELVMQPSIYFTGENVFANNQSAITAGMQAEIDKYINAVKQQIAFNQQNGLKMKYVVSDFKIAASANRFRNLGVASNMTWAELSTKRGTNVKDEILKQLQKLGVDVSKAVNAKINLGYNGMEHQDQIHQLHIILLAMVKRSFLNLVTKNLISLVHHLRVTLITNNINL